MRRVGFVSSTRLRFTLFDSPSDCFSCASRPAVSQIRNSLRFVCGLIRFVAERRWIGVVLSANHFNAELVPPKSLVVRLPRREKYRRPPIERSGVSLWKYCASFAVEVVLPVPLTPTIRMTFGFAGRGSNGWGIEVGRIRPISSLRDFADIVCGDPGPSRRARATV